MLCSRSAHPALWDKARILIRHHFSMMKPVLSVMIFTHIGWVLKQTFTSISALGNISRAHKVMSAEFGFLLVILSDPSEIFRPDGDTRESTRAKTLRNQLNHI